MGHTTLLFLIKKSAGKISHICLAMKKRRFGTGKWNGVGGKLEGAETLEEGLLREVEEEITVIPKNFKKIAMIDFIYSHKPEWDQVAHVYFCEEWEGDPRETEEMKPEWFSVNALPFESMWPDDPLWLPRAVSGENLKCRFVLTEGDKLLEHKVEVVEAF